MKRSVMNKILLLRLVKLNENINSYTKLTQLVYILQMEGRKEKRATFNYAFTRWNCQPYSEELERDIKQLDYEMLIIKEDTLRLSQNGKNLVKKMGDYYIKENIDSFFKFFCYLHSQETLFQTADKINQKYQLMRYSTDEIVSDIYTDERKNEQRMIHKVKRQIDKKFKEIEKAEKENLSRIQELLKRYEDGER